MKIALTSLHCVALCLLAIGVPGFVAFDATAMSQDIGIFNANSLSRIALYLLTGFMLLLIYLQQRKAFNIPRPFQFAKPFALLYGYYLVHTLFFVKGFDQFLALYRIGEWGIVYLVLLDLYHRLGNPPSEIFKHALPYIFGIPIFIICVGVAVFPRIAFAIDDAGFFRLGGYLYHPNTVGVLAGIGVIHGYLYQRNWIRWFSVAFFIVILLLTHSRGALIGLVLAMYTYFTIFNRKKYLFQSITLVVIAGLVVTGEKIVVDFFSRGQGIEGLLTGSERTLAWQASILAFFQSPWIGSGFIVGPKKIGEFFADLDIMHWYTTSAHNDLLQSLVSGGIPAGILTLFFYGALLRGVYRLAKGSNAFCKRSFLYWTTAVQLTVYGLLTPLMNFGASVLSILCLWLFVETDSHLRKLLKAPAITAPKLEGSS